MRIALLAACLACVAGPASAQWQGLADRVARDAELADQNRRSEALNVEVNRKNAEVDARNEATRSAHAQAMDAWRAALAQREAQIRAQDAAAAEARAIYLEGLSSWRRAVDACQAGDRSACAPPAS